MVWAWAFARADWIEDIGVRASVCAEIVIKTMLFNRLTTSALCLMFRKPPNISHLSNHDRFMFATTVKSTSSNLSFELSSTEKMSITYNSLEAFVNTWLQYFDRPSKSLIPTCSSVSKPRSALSCYFVPPLGVDCDESFVFVYIKFCFVLILLRTLIS